MCVKNPKSKFYLSLGLSYPNEQDAARGLKAGVITQSQYEEIAGAIRRRGQPPWKTPLGGEIFIHGHGATGDWTRGCIALDDEPMRALYEVVPAGTPVTIRP